MSVSFCVYMYVCMCVCVCAWGVWCVVCGVWCVVCGVWCLACGVWCVVCGVWCVVCGVWCVVCGVWCAVCGVWCVVCGVWCVVCGVWCVVCGVWCVCVCVCLCVCVCVWCVCVCVCDKKQFGTSRQPRTERLCKRDSPWSRTPCAWRYTYPKIDVGDGNPSKLPLACLSVSFFRKAVCVFGFVFRPCQETYADPAAGAFWERLWRAGVTPRAVVTPSPKFRVEP